jgi:hypothetical protein
MMKGSTGPRSKRRSMTELVDTIKIEITVRHCRDDLKITPLRDFVKKYIGEMVQGASEPCSKGARNWADEKIEVRWNHSGLEEIAEEAGGDN